MLAQRPVLRHRWVLPTLVGVLWVGVVAPVPEAAAAADPPLVEAVKGRDAETARALLDDGADVNQTQPDGATALHWAVYRRDLDMTRLLIAAGANVDAANELGATPLWLAAGEGDAELIGLLLDAGADPNVALPGGETPVMTASRSGTAAGVGRLIAATADVNAREQARQQTALMWAVAQGHMPTSSARSSMAGRTCRRARRCVHA